MKLYYAQGACSLAPHIVLEELGLPYEKQLVSMDAGDMEKPNFLAVNPMGAVPVITLDNGQHLTEGSAILQYLADLKPELNLAPKAGTPERYRLQEALNFVSTEVHKGFGPLFMVSYMSKDPAVVESLRMFWGEMLSKPMAVLQGKLSKQNYLLGANYSVADAYLFVTLNWAAYIKYDISKWPALAAFQARVAARPAVQRAMKDEDLI